MSTAWAERSAWVALVSSLLLALPVHAQERDPAAAEALFAEGRTLMNAQRYAEACLKLAESQRLDPGIGTEFHLAICYEHAGKLASAWAAFLEVASLATASGQPERAKAASRRASLLEPRLPRLKVAVPAASRAAGLEITRDGVVVGAAQWDVALPVDPGDHQFEVTAPGKRAFATAIATTEGATSSFEVPQLEATAAPAVTAVAAAAPAPAEPSASQQPERPAPAQPAPTTPPQRAPSPNQDENVKSSGPSAAVIGLGIVGVVGVGAGMVLGLVASAKNKDSKGHCDPADETRCSDQGVSLRNEAYTFSDLSSVGFIAGGAALLGSGLLWLLDGSSETPDREAASVAVQAGPRAANLIVQGKF